MISRPFTAARSGWVRALSRVRPVRSVGPQQVGQRTGHVEDVCVNTISGPSMATWTTQDWQDEPAIDLALLMASCLPSLFMAMWLMFPKGSNVGWLRTMTKAWNQMCSKMYDVPWPART